MGCEIDRLVSIFCIPEKLVCRFLQVKDKETRCTLEIEMTLVLFTGRLLLWIMLQLMSRCLVTELKMLADGVVVSLENRVQSSHIHDYPSLDYSIFLVLHSFCLQKEMFRPFSFTRSLVVDPCFVHLEQCIQTHLNNSISNNYLGISIEPCIFKHGIFERSDWWWVQNDEQRLNDALFRNNCLHASVRLKCKVFPNII